MSTQLECPYALRPGLTPPPPRVAKLPLDTRGYPIPFFVGTLNGERDFRMTEAKSVVKCIRENVCWVCGEPLFAEKVFVIGPMCSINRISSEPPSHRECAVWSAINCPFLTRPHARRRLDGMPEDSGNSLPGISVRRNPGVTLVWYTRSFELLKLAPRGVLWKLGSPFKWQWFAEGKQATRLQVLESITSGLPILQEEATKEGPAALAELKKMHEASLKYLPKR